MLLRSSEEGIKNPSPFGSSGIPYSPGYDTYGDYFVALHGKVNTAAGTSSQSYVSEDEYADVLYVKGFTSGKLTVGYIGNDRKIGEVIINIQTAVFTSYYSPSATTYFRLA